MNKRYWKDRRVLITGHEGFLGTNLTRQLLSAGANIVGLDIDVFRKHTLLTKEDYRRITSIKGSVADYALVSKILKKFRINTVFHLAAEAIVGRCNEDPICAFKSNIEGTWNILEAARHTPEVRTIVVASSDKAYGSHKRLPYKEDAALIGNHPYDVSKSCADLIAYTYYHTYKSPVAVTRCGNIFGPGDFNFSRIVPDAFRCAIKGDTLMVRSDGKFTRDYVYVDDIAEGYILLAEQLQRKKLSGESFNFSDENPITVIELVKWITKLSDRKMKYRILNEAKYEIKHQYLDSAKARRVLGWRSKSALEDNLATTLRWYKTVVS